MAANEGTIAEIRAQGLLRMSREALLHALQIEVGEPYDERKIQRRFRALWDLKLFEDITFEAENAVGGGKVLIVKVKERPVLSSITYEENKVVTRTQIEDAYKERKLKLGLGKPIDMGQVFFAESAVRDLLSQKGFLDATVTTEIREVTTTSRALHFRITPGGKTRIRKITFTGNELLSNRKLKTKLKLTQERNWYWPWSGKNLYHPLKWDQDVGALRELYQQRGYLDVEFHAPIVDVRKKRGGDQDEQDTTADAKHRAKQRDKEKPAEPEPEPTSDDPSATPLTTKQLEKRAKKAQKQEEQARKRERKAEAKKSKRWVYLTVPITEGEEYRLGEITLEGNEVFPDELLRAMIPIRDGEILNNGALEFGVNRITRVYEDRGYLYANVVRRIERHVGENIADVEISVEEDEPYYVERVEFRGNSRTHDRVLRRELQLMEGDLFSRTRLDRSRGKINQLGYWQVSGEPVIEPIPEEKRVRVTFTGEEQGRNEIQVGGGYSGLEGAFFNGVYSTRNFLGRGQILSTSMQIGGQRDLYQISFQEPWFLNRPYLLGVNLFRRDLDFGGSLRSSSEGAGIVLGKRLTPSSRLSLAYNIESVTSTSFLTTDDNTLITSDAEDVISSITPIFAYSTINNPYRPSRGQSFNFSMQIAGDFLGGDTSYIKPLASYTTYKRFVGRSFLAMNVEAGLVKEIGSGNRIDASNVEGVPRFQRFWLGGDTLGPRVFETRTITPRRRVVVDSDGRILDALGDPRYLSPEDLLTSGGIPALIEVGGDRMFLFQAEWVLPMNEQAEFALFFDAGDALFEDTSLDFSTTRVSAGVELRFHLPIFPVPLRLIYGVPVRELDADRTSSFTFSIGRSF